MKKLKDILIPDTYYPCTDIDHPHWNHTRQPKIHICKNRDLETVFCGLNPNPTFDFVYSKEFRSPVFYIANHKDLKEVTTYATCKKCIKIAKKKAENNEF